MKSIYSKVEEIANYIDEIETLLDQAYSIIATVAENIENYSSDELKSKLEEVRQLLA